ncbi:MAG TPA: succinate dehydrogenase/fumarate reductase iron-sulfur subunit, partial [Thermoanaerobaculia bacterium]|nr:succinate dehydrogenase/fumarate reductase iron-sulfur subunit [Thermoanaerobaculia bacterium]
MNLTLHVWRQKSREANGAFATYKASISADASFLEMLDVVNEELIAKGEEPIHFEHDCREGICGSCGMMINGTAHGPTPGTATCQLHMRHFKDGDEIWVEPWRARAFPVLKDLIVDRSPLDKIIQAGGFISVNTGAAVEANTIPIPKQVQEQSMDAAECIQCGACVA